MFSRNPGDQIAQRTESLVRRGGRPASRCAREHEPRAEEEVRQAGAATGFSSMPHAGRYEQALRSQEPLAVQRLLAPYALSAYLWSPMRKGGRRVPQLVRRDHPRISCGRARAEHGAIEWPA